MKLELANQNGVKQQKAHIRLGGKSREEKPEQFCNRFPGL